MPDKFRARMNQLPLVIPGVSTGRVGLKIELAAFRIVATGDIVRLVIEVPVLPYINTRNGESSLAILMALEGGLHHMPPTVDATDRPALLQINLPDRQMKPAAVHHGSEKLLVAAGLRHDTWTAPVQNFSHPSTPSKRCLMKLFPLSRAQARMSGLQYFLFVT